MGIYVQTKTHNKNSDDRFENKNTNLPVSYKLHTLHYITDKLLKNYCVIHRYHWNIHTDMYHDSKLTSLITNHRNSLHHMDY